MKAKIKKILQLLRGFCIGIGIGLGYVGAIFAVPELRQFLASVMDEHGFLLFMACWFGAMFICVLAAFLQIIIHEAGHLVCGLATGFRVVSFRVANIILVRHDDGWQFGRFSIAGTGGQCLMEPVIEELKDAHQMPYAWYLAGGVIANVVVSAVAIAVLCLHVAGVAGSSLLAMLALTGLYFAIMNGIPMKIGGVANDGDNIRILSKDIDARRMLWVQLKANALYTRGQRLCDMPQEWFYTPDDADAGDHIYASIIGMRASSEMERLDFEAAYTDLRRLRDAGSRLIELLQMETACELLLPTIILHRPQYEIDALMTKRIEEYARTYANYMLSRAVTVYVMERFVKRDAAATQKALQQFERMATRYPTKGELRSCREMMAYLQTLNDEDYATN